MGASSSTSNPSLASDPFQCQWLPPSTPHKTQDTTSEVWCIPSENWCVPSEIYGAPSEIWCALSEIWAAPSGIWCAPLRDLVAPSGIFGAPSGILYTSLETRCAPSEILCAPSGIRCAPYLHTGLLCTLSQSFLPDLCPPQSHRRPELGLTTVNFKPKALILQLTKPGLQEVPYFTEAHTASFFTSTSSDSHTLTLHLGVKGVLTPWHSASTPEVKALVFS